MVGSRRQQRKNYILNEGVKGKFYFCWLLRCAESFIFHIYGLSESYRWEKLMEFGQTSNENSLTVYSLMKAILKLKLWILGILSIPGGIINRPPPCNFWKLGRTISWDFPVLQRRPWYLRWNGKERFSILREPGRSPRHISEAGDSCADQGMQGTVPRENAVSSKAHKSMNTALTLKWYQLHNKPHTLLQVPLSYPSPTYSIDQS